MTALPPKAEVNPPSCYVAEVPGSDICSAANFDCPPRRAGGAQNGRYGIFGDHSALMLAARITWPHFSVSWANSLPNSIAVIGIGRLPRSAMRALILGSARPALISRLS